MGQFMKNMKHNAIRALVIVTGTFLLCPIANADNCPDAKEVWDHAMKEGIGAQWKTGEKLNWYLDNFSNNNKPAESMAGKFTFMQAGYENKELTCYYEWPSDDGKTTNWLSLKLKTTQELKPDWTGTSCSNLVAQNCQFTLVEKTPAAAPATPGAPATPAATGQQPASTGQQPAAPK
jgi:hypothetical protein